MPTVILKYRQITIYSLRGLQTTRKRLRGNQILGKR